MVSYEDLADAVSAKCLLNEGLGIVPAPKILGWMGSKVVSALGESWLNDSLIQNFSMFYVHIACADGERFAGVYNLPRSEPSQNPAAMGGSAGYGWHYDRSTKVTMFGQSKWNVRWMESDGIYMRSGGRAAWPMF